jgi:Holliday junction resolvasome RuvABC DNA-binding subunit
MGEVWYNTHMKTTTTQESKTMDIFEATARNLMSQHDITTRKALVSAMRELGYARFAADRTADKIFGETEKVA